MSLSDLRREYSRTDLIETEADRDPIQQFSKWFAEALATNVLEANAMSLSTVDRDGRPSSRIVLIKDFGPGGFTWFTNYDSRKGRELQANPYAALLFYWIEQERQVRIEGRVARISETESDTYFQSRPLGSRIGALASSQSATIADRRALEAQYAQAEQKYGDHPPRPQHWGGYRLTPDKLEFWQGRPSRLHDRLHYARQADGSWLLNRLQP